MTVKGLWSILAHLPSKFSLNSNCGCYKSVAIDLNIWLMEYFSICNSSTESKLIQLLSRFMLLIQANITIICVLDGRKKATVDIAQDFRCIVEDLLEMLGIPVITVFGEKAEAVCSLLCRNNFVDAVITQDGDALAYGCPEIVKDFSVAKLADGLTQSYRLGSLFFETSDNRHMALTQEDIIAIALLCGSDECDGVSGIGQVAVTEWLTEIKDASPHQNSLDWLLSSCHASYPPKSARSKVCAHPPSEQAIIAAISVYSNNKISTTVLEQLASVRQTEPDLRQIMSMTESENSLKLQQKCVEVLIAYHISLKGREIANSVNSLKLIDFIDNKRGQMLAEWQIFGNFRHSCWIDGDAVHECFPEWIERKESIQRRVKFINHRNEFERLASWASIGTIASVPATSWADKRKRKSKKSSSSVFKKVRREAVAFVGESADVTTLKQTRRFLHVGGVSLSDFSDEESDW